MGPFKAEMWGLPEEIRALFESALEGKFGFYFDQLQVGDTRELIRKFVPLVKVEKQAKDFGVVRTKEEDTSDLAD